MHEGRTLFRGHIRYTSNKPEREGHERGREYFTLTVHDDERTSLTAYCEIDDPPPVIRQVMMSFRPDGRPTDASVRINVDGEFTGHGWFRLTDTLAECETYTAQEGRVSQKFELTEPLAGFGAHPIVGDGLLLRAYDLSQGPGKQFFTNMSLSSPDHRGATGPMIFRLGLGIEYVGEETVEVAAGTFDTLHFRYVDTQGQLPEEHPAYNIWCTKDNFLFVKAQVDGYMQTFYELHELEIF